jgi:hypothetical protein
MDQKNFFILKDYWRKTPCTRGRSEKTVTGRSDSGRDFLTTDRPFNGQNFLLGSKTGKELIMKVKEAPDRIESGTLESGVLWKTDFRKTIDGQTGTLNASSVRPKRKRKNSQKG